MSDEICEMSDLPKEWCAHCKGIKGPEEDEYEVVGRPFDAQYHGRCTIDYDHVVRRGDLVSRVRFADNPMLPVPGVACAACTRTLPRAKRA